MRDIGVYEDWTAVPLETMDGDVVVVSGQRYEMKDGAWRLQGAPGMTPPPPVGRPGYGDKPHGMCPPPLPPGPPCPPPCRPKPHVVDHFGDVRVHGDVLVGGRLVCKDVKQPCVGLFKDFDSLRRRWPHPVVGMWAIVGNTVPGPIYRCEVDGSWIATGETGGDPTLDIDAIEQHFEDLADNYEQTLSDVRNAIISETEERYDADRTLQGLISGLEHTDDELKKIVRGDETVANAWKNPFVDLGNYATQGEVNAKLNSVYHSNDMKYNGLLRISRNGAVMQVSQHGIKTTGDEWYWAQCVAGMVQPSNDGTALDASQKFGICVRWTDYLGNATPWQTYAGGGGGDIQLKTINGQSLKGEGNIEISAEGSITIDDVVSETSANAVSSRAVAHAIADVVNALQALVSSVRSDVSALDSRVSAIEAGSAGDVEAIRTALNALQATYEAKMILVDADIQQLKTRTQNVRLCVGAFVGSVASANVMGASSPSQGEIVFVQNDGTGSPQFSMRVPQSGGGYTYFNNWDGASAFKTYENTATWWKPREDSVYINTATDTVYTYDAATMSLKQVTGGSVEADTTLDINSKNAVANSAVSRVLNTQQTAITNLQADIARIDRQGVPSTVQGDEVTVSGNADGGSAKVRLADIKTTEVRGESQEVVKVRSVGTTHVTDASMPSGSDAEARMRYKLYNDVTTGNKKNDAGTITLAAGSKLEPAGGVPGKTYNGQGEQISVEGGELSWVHSSDIGMIQDDLSLSDKERTARGKHNADVLRMVAASRWNLILDGMYYVDVGITAGSGTRETLVDKAVTLRRPLRIKGGGLATYCYLFCVEAGGGLVLEDVVLDSLKSYGMIYMNPWGGLIESVELYRCSLKTSAAPIEDSEIGEMYEYAWVGDFITGSGKNVGPVDTENELSPNGMVRYFNKPNGVDFLGLPSYGDDTKSNWGLKSATASTPTQNLCYNEAYNPEHPYFPGDKASRQADAWCCYDQGAPLFAPYAEGKYVFRQRLDKVIDGVTVKGSTTKHKGMWGDFVLYDETDPTKDVYYTENNATVFFTPIYLKDSAENGTIHFNANPAVEHNGLKRFIVNGCSIMSHVPVFVFSGMEVLDEFRISNNLFYEIGSLAMNLGTSNDMESHDEWQRRSCPLEICGNTFRGLPTGAQHTTGQPYAGILVYEGDTVLFHDNLVENLISDSNTYDCYLSCAKVEYRRNIIRNLLKFNFSRTLYGYFKAKGVRVGHNYYMKYGGDMMNHPKKLSRLYEDNLFEVNMKDVRQICDKILKRLRKSVLPAYNNVNWEEVPQEAKDEVIRERVLRTMFDGVVATWSFDTFTIRNNIFDMPDCLLNGPGPSGGSAKIRRFVFSDNVMKFRGYCNTPANGNDAYLFTIDPVDGVGEVEIVGNRFESKRREIINLLCLNRAVTLRSLRMEDNEFVDCGYRMAQRFRAQTAGASATFDGVIQAEHLCLRNNREDAGLDEGFTGKYSVQRMFGTWYLPVQFRGHGGTDDVVEFWDSQRRGVSAPTAKMLLLPVGAGGMTVRSTHWCRPMDVENAWLPQTGGPYEYSDKSLSLLYTFATMGREGGAGGIVPKGYCVAVRYCVKGQWKERKLEMRCSENLAGRAEGSTATELGVSARGTDGRRICHKADVAAERATYTRHATVSARNTQVDWLDDLGLGFLLLCRAVMDTDFTLGTFNTPMLRLALYTGADGTKNDPGTEITMTVTDIDPAADLAGEGGTKVLGASSPFESFLPKGSTLTSDERTALKTGDTTAFKIEPSDAGVVHSATLPPGDAGWWCVDPDSGHVVVWTGTAWSE